MRWKGGCDDLRSMCGYVAKEVWHEHTTAKCFASSQRSCDLRHAYRLRKLGLNQGQPVSIIAEALIGNHHNQPAGRHGLTTLHRAPASQRRKRIVHLEDSFGLTSRWSVAELGG